MEWTRIPAEITAEADRRELVAILASAGLEVRIVKVRETSRASVKRYIEYKEAK